MTPTPPTIRTRNFTTEPAKSAKVHCEGPHWPCPNCGKPTANMNDYSERYDPAYCSPSTSPACWGSDSAQPD